MKKLILLSFALLLLVLTRTFAQPCTPNNDTVSGIEPDTLSVAYVDVAYEEVIYFRLPADTVVEFVIGTDTILLTVCIDSLTIDSIHGLPVGFAIACNVPWCSVLGGDNGCAVVAGTATSSQVGIYPLHVFVTVYTNDCFLFDLPPQNDTVSFYFLDIQLAQGIESLPLANDFSIGRCYPNPASEEVSIPLYLRHSESVSFTVFDLHGKEYLHERMDAKAGYQLHAIDISSLEPGSYFLQAKMEGKEIHEKLQVIR